LTTARGLLVFSLLCGCYLIVYTLGYRIPVYSYIDTICHTPVESNAESPGAPPNVRVDLQDEQIIEAPAASAAKGRSTTIPMSTDFVDTEFDRMVASLQKDGYVVLHQTWKDTCVLETKVEHMKSWESIEGKKIKVIFWTDETMDTWVYERFKGTYIQDGWEVVKKTDKAHIKKADVFRAMLIWYYGGVYADLDIQLRESFREFLEEKAVLIAWEPREGMERWSSYKAGDDIKTFMLSGFLLSGEKFSGFVAFLVNWILNRHLEGKSTSSQDVLYATGPAAEASAYYAYTDQLQTHDRRLHVMTYTEFLHYAEHFSATTWLPGSIQGIGCVDITSIYSNSTLIMGNPL